MRVHPRYESRLSICRAGDDVARSIAINARAGPSCPNSVFGVKAEVPPLPLIDLQCRAVLKWILARARDFSLERARFALSTKMATSLARSRVHCVVLAPLRLVESMSHLLAGAFRAVLPRVEVTASTPAAGDSNIPRACAPRFPFIYLRIFVSPRERLTLT